MVTFRIYVEGGGDSHDQETLFRRGWSKFFENAGLRGRMPAIVRGGGRQSTFDDFCVAIENPKPSVVSLLLVDAEAPVAAGLNVWQHLATRDAWVKPQNAADDSAFMMVQMMEHWFLADPNALEKYFGQGFKKSAIRRWPALEAVTRETVMNALAQATQNCTAPSITPKANVLLKFWRW